MKQPLSYVHRDAKIAETVVIDPFVTIDRNVEIGEGTWIGPNVTIFPNVKIGKNCKIFPGAVIGAIPQDLKFAGEETWVEIGDNTTIRECVTINRGTKTSYKTTIGNNCLLMAYVHVAHDCHLGNNIILGNSTQLAGEVHIDDFAILSGIVAVHQFVRIGAHVMVSGGSLVRKDVPPYVKAAREPLSFVGINSIGLRRRNYTNEKINEIQEIYRILFLKGLNNSQALDYVEAHMPATKERDEIITFIRNSTRGIMKGYFPE
ncbi:MAG: acyl-[acyl-carrier-protein]--UDP-N-acetylglucosamine O-acyltransferase [Bacteroidetes bacterium RIFOXYA12_FULL_35_11]|nr:MAG: acyl-[acyl-carrier-protein]--UDP-N-acetylglucosamine O-acyltransferase [Bacteroidetes bacterium GWF2_35_48]OFY73704.1 MAG: acyl-[acyl-carrier-protein]--UDP-N-acetylglucosamine O-acyltransferase [Bacteroidetes bacterium RIFOXYA12_FULL_35_11]OFY92792.1 MAG: acyl-[acyl-carrier-protein]--UDP-N-acetylglucosamine O-acyltransferase [Bacteroidetes bacterium RIFOXYC12_FULL_35_7]OFY96661.1 MAG: acyl-[acyl-carrier-protein]--UDP-N-acetylglucosamine O-acyltransferase [Bacteroidetes bacterium RIFOXYB2